MTRTARNAAALQIVPAAQSRSCETQTPRSGRETDLRLLLTVSEAAHRLGIGRSLLYELLAGDQIESIHVGRLRRIPTDALATYIEEQRQHSTARGN